MTGLIARVGVCGAAAWLSIGLWSGNAFSQTAAGAADKPLPSPSSVQGSNVSPSHGASTKVSEKHQLIVTQDYIIGPEDVLEITVWRNQDLSKVVAVRPDGRISLPLIGDVTAVGKTPAQLTEEISAKLKEYKENPSVAILMKEINSYAIFVLGEVAKPGRYPLKSKTTLLQGITVAGGFTPVAARNKLVVFRFSENGHGDEKIKASYDDIVLRDGSKQNFELKPGDTIVVPSETMVLIP
ncbi:MAG: polysaccharide biosynthesis/export family protein [Nitrospiraceae bacterium]